jgi:hypothetical protein
MLKEQDAKWYCSCSIVIRIAVKIKIASSERTRMHLSSLRRWWDERSAPWAERWEFDASFRHSVSFLLAALTLALMGLCIFLGWSIAHTAMPQWFAHAPIQVSDGDQQNVNYPLAAITPMPAQNEPAPMAVATSALPGPTPSPSPTPKVSPTPTFPTPVPPVCPSLGGTPPLTGRQVQDGTNPTPLVGGCPANLVIVAASRPNAPITVTLTFGTADPIACTLTLTGTTDAQGNATLPLRVPGTHCFRGNILTTGTVTVGGDTSANANFSAQG